VPSKAAGAVRLATLVYIIICYIHAHNRMCHWLLLEWPRCVVFIGWYAFVLFIMRDAIRFCFSSFVWVCTRIFGYYQFLTDYGFNSCLTVVDFIQYWLECMGMPFEIFVFVIYRLFLVDKVTDTESDLGPIPRPEESYRMCVCVSLTVIRCNYYPPHLQWAGRNISE